MLKQFLLMSLDKIKIIISKNKVLLLLTFIFLLGSCFRFYNLDWDKGYIYHPDEAGNIIFPSLALNSNDLNPHRFVYGGLTIYLYRFIGEIVSLLTNNKTWITDYSKLNLIGHYVSALVSSFSVILVFYISNIVFKNNKINLLSSLLTALTVSLIQAAHFSTTENLLIFWLLLIYILSFRILNNQNYKNYERLGIISGLAIATKTTGASFLLVPVLIHFFISLEEASKFLKLTFFEKIKGLKELAIGKPSLFWHKQTFLLRFIFFTFIFFFLFSPFSLLDYKDFKSSTDYEINVASGKTQVFYTYQFIKTVPYRFYIDNLLWAQGPFLKFFSIAGFIYLSFLIFAKRNRKIIILVIWPILYFYIIGGWHTKFIRYIFLLLPFLAIFAAKFLIDFQNKFKIVGKVLIISTIIFTFAYSLAFLSIYKKENTRVSASKWIYDNISQGSKIYAEQFEYPGLPLHISNESPSMFKIEVLNIYDNDNNQKIKYYSNKLANGDYIIIGSRRLYGTLMNIPEKYPITSQYYKLLFDGKLGYNLIATFSSYPSFMKYEINDDKSEETFQVFDHPKILIFKNEKYLGENEIYKLFNKPINY